MNKKYRLSSDDKVIAILNRLKTGESLRSLAKEYGISRTTIYLWSKRTGVKKPQGVHTERDWKRILLETGGENHAN